jgi:hypothetical protein
MGSSLTLGIGAGLAQAQGTILASSSLLPFFGTDDDDVITIPGFTDDSLIGLGGQDTLSGGRGFCQ